MYFSIPKSLIPIDDSHNEKVDILDTHREEDTPTGELAINDDASTADPSTDTSSLVDSKDTLSPSDKSKYASSVDPSNDVLTDPPNVVPGDPPPAEMLTTDSPKDMADLPSDPSKDLIDSPADSSEDLPTVITDSPADPPNDLPVDTLTADPSDIEVPVDPSPDELLDDHTIHSDEPATMISPVAISLIGENTNEDEGDISIDLQSNAKSLRVLHTEEANTMANTSTARDLKNMCKNMGLPTQGKKIELAQRILEQKRITENSGETLIVETSQ